MPKWQPRRAPHCRIGWCSSSWFGRLSSKSGADRQDPLKTLAPFTEALSSIRHQDSEGCVPPVSTVPTRWYHTFLSWKETAKWQFLHHVRVQKHDRHAEIHSGLPFSSSRTRRRFTSDDAMPPNFVLSLQNVAKLIP